MMEHALIEYLANALWQIPLLAAGAWLLLAAGRPGPQTEYRVWLAVLSLAVLLPLHGMGAPQRAAPARPRPTLEVRAQAAGMLAPPSAAEAETASMSLPGGVEQARAVRLYAKLAPYRVTISTKAAHWITGLYAGVVLFALSRVVGAWRAAQRMVESASEITLAGEHRVVLEDYGRRLRVRLPEVRGSVEISSPMIVGVMLPVLLLPERFDTWSAEEIRAALLHEFAHVKRRDTLENAICQVAALPVAWHPATVWVQSRVRRAREMACDRMAAGEMQSDLVYARSLLSLARKMLEGTEFDRRAFKGQAANAGLFSGRFNNHAMEERVMRLVKIEKRGTMRTRMVRAAGGTAAMAAAAGVAVMFHLTPVLASSGAQTQAAASSAALRLETSPPALAANSAAPPIAARAAAASARAAAKQSAASTAASAALAASAAPGIAETTSAQVGPAAAAATATQPASDAPKQPAVEQREPQHGEPFAIVDGVRRPLTSEEKRRVDEAMARARREIAEATAKIHSPEFKKQIEDVRAQAVKTSEMVNNAQYKKSMEDARAQAAKAQQVVNSPEFQEEIADAQAETQKVREFVNSAGFKEQLDEVRKTTEEMKIELPKIQMEGQKAIAQIDSPEFRKQMQEVQQLDLEKVRKMTNEEMRKLNESMRQKRQVK